MHVRFLCPRPRLFVALAVSFLVVWLVAGAVFLYGFVTLAGALSACATQTSAPGSAPARSARPHEDPDCRPASSGASTTRRHGPYGDTGDDARWRSTGSSEVDSASPARSGRRR